MKCTKGKGSGRGRGRQRRNGIAVGKNQLVDLLKIDIISIKLVQEQNCYPKQKKKNSCTLSCPSLQHN